jgi:adenylate cyclase
VKSIFFRSALIAITAFLLGCLVDEGFQIETRLGLDALFSLRGVRTTPQDVVIVTIDEYSDEEYKIGTDFTRWRSKHAQLLKALTAQNVALIIFDLYFSDTQYDVDPTLAKAMKEAGNVLSVDCVQTERNGWGMCGRRPAPDGPIEIYPPIAVLAESMLAHAPFFLGDDAGNYVVRQSWSFLDDIPTLPVLAWLHLLEQNGKLSAALAQPHPLSVELSKQRQQCISQSDKYIQKTPKISPDEKRITELICRGETRFIDYYGPPKTLKMLSYSDVREGRINNLAGKIVFVGQIPRKTLPLIDSFVTPYTDTDSGKMAGVEIMATHFANLLEGREIAPPAPPGLTMAIFGFIISLILIRFAGFPGITVSFLFSALYLSLAVWCFNRNGMWLPVAVPLLLQLPLAVLLSLYWSRLDQLAEAKKLKAVIEQVTTENTRLINHFIEQLNHANPFTLSLSGEGLSEKVSGVCLVSDIEGFTELAEETPPDILLDKLRDYFKALGTVISSQGGKIANIAGDGMVAIWIDQHLAHQKHSICLATVEMKKVVDQLNASSENIPFLTRFGLHEGEFALGKKVGDKLDDNAIGNAINTAARLENANKLLGTRILASSSITANISNVMVRPVGTFQLMGKNQSIELVEIVGIRSELSKTKIAFYKHFAKGLKAFDNGEWQDSLTIFQQIANRYGYDGPTSYYLKLLEAQDKPPPDWKGFIKLETK